MTCWIAEIDAGAQHALHGLEALAALGVRMKEIEVAILAWHNVNETSGRRDNQHRSHPSNGGISKHRAIATYAMSLSCVWPVSELFSSAGRYGSRQWSGQQDGTDRLRICWPEAKPTGLRPRPRWQRPTAEGWLPAIAAASGLRGW